MLNEPVGAAQCGTPDAVGKEVQHFIQDLDQRGLAVKDPKICDLTEGAGIIARFLKENGACPSAFLGFLVKEHLDLRGQEILVERRHGGKLLRRLLPRDFLELVYIEANAHHQGLLVFGIHFTWLVAWLLGYGGLVAGKAFQFSGAGVAPADPLLGHGVLELGPAALPSLVPLPCRAWSRCLAELGPAALPSFVPSFITDGIIFKERLCLLCCSC